MALLARGDYVADRAIATVAFLSLKMGRPLFLEGEAGVGKTEIAKVLAQGLGKRLIRLQCYEGLDVSSAVYEWNYPRQMVAIRMAEAGGDMQGTGHNIYTDAYLIKRPLLDALEGDGPVLLVDEIDRTDEAFEAYLLEILSDFQISIPEIGTVSCENPPIVIITSNRTREVHDALKRRCLYHWVDYPEAEREMEILKARKPGVEDRLAKEVVAYVRELRDADLYKRPGVAETIDWVTALHELDAISLDPQRVNDTLGVLLKYQDDIAKMQGSEAKKMLDKIQADLAAAG